MRIYYYFFLCFVSNNIQFAHTRRRRPVCAEFAGRGRQIINRKLQYTRIIITRTHILYCYRVCVWSAFSAAFMRFVR